MLRVFGELVLIAFAVCVGGQWALRRLSAAGRPTAGAEDDGGLEVVWDAMRPPPAGGVRPRRYRGRRRAPARRVWASRRPGTARTAVRGVPVMPHAVVQRRWVPHWWDPAYPTLELPTIHLPQPVVESPTVELPTIRRASPQPAPTSGGHR